MKNESRNNKRYYELYIFTLPMLIGCAMIYMQTI